jgi:hypothetical protein
MTLPTGDSAEENFELRKCYASPPADAVGQGIALTFLLLFVSRQKVKKEILLPINFCGFYPDNRKGLFQCLSRRMREKSKEEKLQNNI